MKQLLAVALGLALLFSLLLTVLTAIERLAPLPAAIIDMNGLQHSPPCWYGVCPGQSTLSDVEKNLPKIALHVIGTLQPDLPEYDGRPPTVHNPCVDILVSKGWQACFYQGTEDGKVNPVTLWSDGDSLRLGDMISALGIPEAVSVCGAHYAGAQFSVVRTALLFKGHIVVNAVNRATDVNRPPLHQDFSPQMTIYSIVYSTDAETAGLDDSIYPHWSGFTLRNQPDLNC